MGLSRLSTFFVATVILIISLGLAGLSVSGELKTVVGPDGKVRHVDESDDSIIDDQGNVIYKFGDTLINPKTNTASTVKDGLQIGSDGTVKRMDDTPSGIVVETNVGIQSTNSGTDNAPNDNNIKYTIYIKPEKLNIRSGPSTEYKVIAQAFEGDKYVVVDKSGDWLKIALKDGAFGWVHKDYTKDGTAEEYFRLGEKAYQDKDYEKTVKYLQQAVKLEPNNSDWHNRLGDAYYYIKDYEKALREYSKTIEINSIDGNAYLGLGSVYCKKNDFYKAAYYWKHGASLGDESCKVNYEWIVNKYGLSQMR
jgi:Bacterial SH3 domain/TPR repeat